MFYRKTPFAVQIISQNPLFYIATIDRDPN
jgi:hypothetical protein